MRKLILLCLICTMALSWDAIKDEEHYQNFRNFAEKYEKVYTTEAELVKRFNIFRNNIKYVFEHKVSDVETDYGVTDFSDLTPEEFENQYLTLNTIDMEEIEAEHKTINLAAKQEIDVSHLPKNFDWRTKGVVSKVKQQSTCGSCWTFSTTGVLESQIAIKTGQLVSLSEQQLVDCDSKNKGCHGGLMHKAYKSIQEWGGLELESTYGPYANSKGNCHKNEQNFVVDINEYFLSDKNEAQIMYYLVNYGPLAAGINARYLQFYKKGIHSHKLCDDKINHAVLIVGYGTENGNDYWIVKNQWGTHWGEKGFFRLIRNKKHCGIHTYVSGVNIELL